MRYRDNENLLQFNVLETLEHRRSASVLELQFSSVQEMLGHYGFPPKLDLQVDWAQCPTHFTVLRSRKDVAKPRLTSHAGNEYQCKMLSSGKQLDSKTSTPD